MVINVPVEVSPSSALTSTELFPLMLSMHRNILSWRPSELSRLIFRNPSSHDVVVNLRSWTASFGVVITLDENITDVPLLVTLRRMVIPTTPAGTLY